MTGDRLHGVAGQEDLHLHPAQKGEVLHRQAHDLSGRRVLGRIIEVATTEQLFTALAHPYTRGLLAAIPPMTASTADEAPAVVGDPPSPLRIPAGCRFRTRCPIAQDICSREDPMLTAAPGQPGHTAACHDALGAAPPAAAAASSAGLKEEPSPSQS